MDADEAGGGSTEASDASGRVATKLDETASDLPNGLECYVERVRGSPPTRRRAGTSSAHELVEKAARVAAMRGGRM